MLAGTERLNAHEHPHKLCWQQANQAAGLGSVLVLVGTGARSARSASSCRDSRIRLRPLALWLLSVATLHFTPMQLHVPHLTRSRYSQHISTSPSRFHSWYAHTCKHTQQPHNERPCVASTPILPHPSSGVGVMMPNIIARWSVQ